MVDDELEIPLKLLQKDLKKEIDKWDNIIVEGHLICEIRLPVDWAVLLRVHPELLEARLEAKQYMPAKVQDNVFCEGIDYCKKHALRNYKEKVIEVYGKNTAKETLKAALKEMKKKGAI